MITASQDGEWRGIDPAEVRDGANEGSAVIRTSAFRLMTICTTAAISCGVLASGPHGMATSEQAAGSPTARRVIVIGSTAGGELVQRAVTEVGGRVTRDLPIIDGVAATVSASRAARLAKLPGIASVSPDTRVDVQGSSTGSGVAPPASVYRTEVGAADMQAAGYRGGGVTVALLDTGITPSPDLAGRILPVTDPMTGAVAQCENLSGEGTCDDNYGHGTFLAGLIAGDGTGSSGRYAGVAPGANLVSIKVGSADGSADVSSVLAGIQWAVSFRETYRIRVLNLSLGTDSTQSWQIDPLNYAVERAWAAGIAVVVAASNRGPAAGTISKPADDPWVITVGAVDYRATSPINDDRLPDFSGRGPTADGLAKPDVVAPGAHLVSLRSAGSTIDRAFPSYIDGAYHRGSGTSMAAAVVSGVAALVLSAKPNTSPDRLKYALTSTARGAASADPYAVGSGIVDAYEATFKAPTGLANQGLARSTGAGSLAASRGSVTVRTLNPLLTVLDAGLTVQLITWDAYGYATGDWTGRTWVASPWYTAPFYRTNWYGHNWTGHNWTGSQWYGSSEGTSYGDPAPGSAWYGAWG